MEILDLIWKYLVQLGAVLLTAGKCIHYYFGNLITKIEDVLSGHTKDIQTLNQKVAVHDVLFEKVDGNIDDIKSTLIRIENRIENIIYDRK